MKWYLFVGFVLAWCAARRESISPDYSLTDEPNLIVEAFNNASVHQHHLHARDYVQFDPNDVASQAVWDTAVTNGNLLSCMMRRTDVDAGKVLRDNRNPPSAESKFRGRLPPIQRVNLFQSWGWHEFPVADDLTQFETYWGWAAALLSFEKKYSGPNNIPVRLGHADPSAGRPMEEQHYTGPDGRFYWVTGSHNSFILNRPPGFIFIAGFSSIKGSFEQLQRHAPTAADLPGLRSLSDILWLYWYSAHAKTPTYVKYFGHARITGKQSRQIIASAFQGRGQFGQLPVWPGITFSRDDKAGKALIGSIGMTCAQFLFAHKEVLGLKHIQQVTVFRDPFTEWYPQILFYIENVPANLLIPQEAPDWQPGAQNAPPGASIPKARSLASTRLYERDANGNYFRVHNLTLG